MPKKPEENIEYDNLRSAIKARKLCRLYAFWGEERYLMENYIRQIRSFIPKGTEEFNHRRFDGKTLSVTELSQAVDALPVFSDMTLIEISDFDFSKLNEENRTELIKILSDIPEYACVIFVFDTVEFKVDGRTKSGAALKKLFTSVEFRLQDQKVLIGWIAKHFKSGEKQITREAAEHLIFMTGGLMSTLDTEIEKLIAYSMGDVVTVEDVDAVVTPVLDAASYELTDAIISGKNDLAVKKLGELMQMNEAPHKILYSISAKLRQLLCARICIDSGKSIGEFMKLAGVRYEFQARGVYNAARRLTLSQCGKMVSLAANTAYKLNSTNQDGGELLSELIIRLAIIPEEARIET
ncbi:MAG: DNA polymerase III subunit delta [Oscillospiraceae bacterium]